MIDATSTLNIDYAFVADCLCAPNNSARYPEAAT